MSARRTARLYVLLDEKSARQVIGNNDLIGQYKGMFLSDSDFIFILKNAPLISIDLVMADPAGAILMGWRRNQPAKGTWFVPGGRIQKDEKIAEAFERLTMTETGFSRKITESRFGGVYEHHYPTNVFVDPDFTTHYCVLAYVIRLAQRPEIKIDEQHDRIEWLTPSSPHIHPYSRAYFDLVNET